MKNKTTQNILIFIGPCAYQALMGKSLVAAHWLFVNPVLQAKAFALFEKYQHTGNLTLIESKNFPNKNF